MLNGDIDILELTGDISDTSELEGDIDNQIELDTEINPIVPVIMDNDYNDLYNKPKINSVELVGDKTLDELDIQIKGDYPDQALTNSEIEELLNNFA